MHFSTAILSSAALLSGMVFAAPMPLHIAPSAGDTLMGSPYIDLVGHDSRISRGDLTRLVARGIAPSVVSFLYMRADNPLVASVVAEVSHKRTSAKAFNTGIRQVLPSGGDSADATKWREQSEHHSQKAKNYGHKVDDLLRTEEGSKHNPNQAQKALASANEAYKIGGAADRAKPSR